METIKNRNLWVYDIETLKSLWTYTGKNVDTKEVVQFVIHKELDQREGLDAHLKICEGMIGFNNLDFDYPVIHTFLNNHLWESPEEMIDLLYTKAQEIINGQAVSENFSRFSSTTIREKNVLIPQLDLYKMWHFNNAARRTSLKALEISMNFPNVMEMEIHHGRDDIRLDEIPTILEYNLNDVEATYEFYLRSEEKIKLRRNLNKKYKLGCMNFSDSKIGEKLVLKLYCDKTNKDIWEVNKMRTNRDEIALKDCIFPYIKFKSKEFNELLTKFNSKVIKETKKSIEESVVYKGFKYDFGTGGIHGCIKAGVYDAGDGYIIIDADVASLYPSIAILNKLYPEHLGEDFCSVYEEDIVKPRLAAKKAGDMTMADGFKLSANSVYGKSNDEYSFLKDPMYTMKTTINGELMLSMLAEDLVNNIEDLTMLQINTDGLTVKIKEKDIDIYYNICKEWEQITKLTLEYIEYSKMVINDVNNYMAISTKGKIKYKGAFEVDKDYHKDNSFRIIPFTLSEFFINGINVEETIINHKNIYDFCGRHKFKGQDYGEIHFISNDETGSPIIKIQRQQKNVRYFVSNKGATFIKQYKKGTSQFINKGYGVTIFNNYINQSDYNINYDFYIKECNKIINTINNNQTLLF